MTSDNVRLPNMFLMQLLTALALMLLVITFLSLAYPSLLSAFWHSLSAISRGNPLGGEYP